jgi:hypothetical protein
MTTENSARASVVPSHGVGRIAPWQTGQSGNPGGRPTQLREVRTLCRNKSLLAAEALIDVIGRAKERDVRGVPIEDGRVVVVAAQQVLTWAFGKPPDYAPKEDRPAQVIDVSVLSTAEQRMLLDFLRRGLVREAPAETLRDIESAAEQSMRRL